MKKIHKYISIFILSISFEFAYGGMIIPEPDSLEGYIKSSDLVVVGSIVGVDKIHNFYGYQENAASREAYERKLISQGVKIPFSMGVPLIDFKIDVSEIIKSNNKSAAAGPVVVTYRKYIGNQSVAMLSDYQNSSEKYIFFLRMNPDNKTYGIMGASHEVLLDEAGTPLGYKTRSGIKKFLSGKLDSKKIVELSKSFVLSNN